MTTKRLTTEEFEKILLENNYGKIYYEFLKNRLNFKYAKNMKKEAGYEIHHIIPRAYGGTNKYDNKIKLSTFDHILAHYYLVLATDNIMMYHAFNCIHGSRFKTLSEVEQIQLCELKHWAEIRDKTRIRLFSDEARQTISEKAKQRWANFKESGRIEEVKKNISTTTKEGMSKSLNAQIKTRVNLGSKKYYNESEDKEMNWYPGMSEPDPTIWRRGRRPMKKESKEKLKNTLQNNKRIYYHNDKLKINSTFGEHDIIPEGWIKGQKSEYMGNNNKYKHKKSIQDLEKLKTIKN